MTEQFGILRVDNGRLIVAEGSRLPFLCETPEAVEAALDRDFVPAWREWLVIVPVCGFAGLYWPNVVRAATFQRR